MYFTFQLNAFLEYWPWICIRMIHTEADVIFASISLVWETLDSCWVHRVFGSKKTDIGFPFSVASQTHILLWIDLSSFNVPTLLKHIYPNVYFTRQSDTPKEGSVERWERNGKN